MKHILILAGLLLIVGCTHPTEPVQVMSSMSGTWEWNWDSITNLKGTWEINERNDSLYTRIFFKDMGNYYIKYYGHIFGDSVWLSSVGTSPFGKIICGHISKDRSYFEGQQIELLYQERDTMTFKAKKITSN